MEPVYLQGYEPEKRRYQSHYDLIQHNRQIIMVTYFGSVCFWILMTFLVMEIQTRLMEAGIKDPKSSWNAIKQKSRSKQWLHASYVLSIIHALILMGLAAIGCLACSPPEMFTIQNGGFLANTCFFNDFCVDNGNKWELICVLFFSAYLSVDFIVCIFLIADKTSGAIENYVHHMIGLLGTGTSIIVGRMILTLSVITCFTEFSTPFVSMRGILYMHGKSSSLPYIINGMMMTFSFGVSRCCFQTWLVATRLVPAVLDRSHAMLSDSSLFIEWMMWFSLSMYVALCFLNFYWFYLMFSGMLKFFSKAKKADTQKKAQDIKKDQ